MFHALVRADEITFIFGAEYGRFRIVPGKRANRIERFPQGNDNHLGFRLFDADQLHRAKVAGRRPVGGDAGAPDVVRVIDGLFGANAPGPVPQHRRVPAVPPPGRATHTAAVAVACSIASTASAVVITPLARNPKFVMAAL